ncbi:MAG: PPOX class F420-dependent oxidoreductase [Acidimicrobiia bacterium]|nr:MAG: PPOX class F420-dependent oxidoreductase [Acidimicrobiia bacterium]
MNPGEALHRFGEARFAVMATLRPDGSPHLVPITFALVDDSHVVTAIDWKPKSGRPLQRIANLEHDPRTSLLADERDEDWSRLWWVRVDGRATIFRDHAARWLEALSGKYPQYAERPPDGPYIVVEIDRVVGWAAS